MQGLLENPALEAVAYEIFTGPVYPAIAGKLPITLLTFTLAKKAFNLRHKDGSINKTVSQAISDVILINSHLVGIPVNRQIEQWGNSRIWCYRAQLSDDAEKKLAEYSPGERKSNLTYAAGIVARSLYTAWL